MAKNPFMSAYLSAANRAANTARGKATNEVKRESKKQATEHDERLAQRLDTQAEPKTQESLTFSRSRPAESDAGRVRDRRASGRCGGGRG